jgi:hypothetical protein
VDKINCPCGGVANLTQKPHEVGNKIINWYYYECGDCDEKWTTTESDTKSYENIDFTEHE